MNKKGTTTQKIDKEFLKYPDKQNALIPSNIDTMLMFCLLGVVFYLAYLAAGICAVFTTLNEDWNKQLGSEISVILKPLEDSGKTVELERVKILINNIQYVKQVEAFNLERTTELLIPWLNSASKLKLGVLPQMIAVKLDEGLSKQQFEAVVKELRDKLGSYSQIDVDDNQFWLSTLNYGYESSMLFLAYFFALILIVSIVFAVICTRNMLNSWRDTFITVLALGTEKKAIYKYLRAFFISNMLRSVLGALLAVALTFLLIPILVYVFASGGSGVDVLSSSEYFLLNINLYFALLTALVVSFVATYGAIYITCYFYVKRQKI